MRKENLFNVLKKIVRIAKLAFTPIAICFLLYFTWNTRNQINLASSSLQFEWVIGSLLLWISLHLVSPIFTIRVFSALSCIITYKEAFLIHSRRLPAKYLPGGIWHSVVRATDYHSYGFSKTKIGIYLLLENILAAFVTLMMGGIIVSMLEGINQHLAMLLHIYITLGLAALLLAPFFIHKIIPKHIEKPTIKPLYHSLIFLIFYWFIAAASFICFIFTVPALEIGVSLFEAGGIYIFSWGVGFITLIAPQGIGISELVSAKLLNSGLSTQNFIVLLASFRLISLVGDLLVWLMGVFINWILQPNKPTS